MRFYIAYLPFILKQVLPFVTVAAGFMTVAQLKRNNEVMPVVAAGVSVRRLFFARHRRRCSRVRPALLVQRVPAALDLARTHRAQAHVQSGDRRPELMKLAHLRDGKGTVTRAKTYSFADQSLTQVTVNRPWGPTGFERLTAERLEPDGEAWRCARRGAAPAGRPARGSAKRLPPGTRVDFGVSPDDVEAMASKQGTAEISSKQLLRLTRKFPGRRHLHVAFYKQIARPLTSLVLLLVVIPIVHGLDRRRFLAAILAITLCACYFFLDIFCLEHRRPRRSRAGHGGVPAARAAVLASAPRRC